MKTFTPFQPLLLLLLAFFATGCGAQSASSADEDQAVIEQLREAGSDLSKPHPINFFLYLPDEASARRAAKGLVEKGFKVDVAQAEGESAWLTTASTIMVPTLANIQAAGEVMAKLAEQEGGDYDGWEAQVVP